MATLRLLIALGACMATAIACDTRTAPAKGPATMESDSPFQLSLTATDAPGLKATLLNRSSKEQLLFHDPMLQPTQLVLIGADGKPVSPTDVRANRKFDNTPYRDLYVELKPDATVTLMEATFKRQPGGYTLRWGPWEFTNLPPGAYTAHVTFTHQQDQWFDRDTHESGRFESIWKGELKSPEVKLALPE